MNLPEIEGYQFEELIGEGGCGFVYRCRHDTGEIRVVNVIKALAVNPALLRENLERLARAPAHPGLVDLYGYNFTENPYYQITSLHGRKNPSSGEWDSDAITGLIGKLDEEQASGLVDQLVELTHASVCTAHRKRPGLLCFCVGALYRAQGMPRTYR